MFWSNISTEVKPCEDLKKEGTYDKYRLSLHLCNKTILDEHISDAVTRYTVNPWLVGKKSPKKEKG